CIAWNVGELEIADVRIAGLAPPCMTGDDGGLLLSRDRSSGRSALAFALEAQPLAARVTHGGETWTVEGAWPELEVEGVIDADGIERLSARFANGALTSASHGLAAERVSGMLEMSNGALAPSTLRVGKLESLESPPW